MTSYNICSTYHNSNGFCTFLYKQSCRISIINSSADLGSLRTRADFPIPVRSVYSSLNRAKRTRVDFPALIWAPVQLGQSLAHSRARGNGCPVQGGRAEATPAWTCQCTADSKKLEMDLGAVNMALNRVLIWNYDFEHGLQ